MEEKTLLLLDISKKTEMDDLKTFIGVCGVALVGFSFISECTAPLARPLTSSLLHISAPWHDVTVKHKNL